MVWEINGTDRFAALEVSEQDAVIAVVELLAEHGPQLDRRTPIGSRGRSITT